MIPFSVEGSIEIRFNERSYRVEDACAAIEEGLLAQEAKDMVSAGGVLRFNVSTAAFFSRWNPLAGVTSGKIEVADRGGRLLVSFTLQFLRAVLILTAVTGVMVAQMLAVTRTLGQTPWMALGVIAVGCVITVALSHIGSALRFRSFLQGLVAELPPGR